jgi:hypothetical protein
VKSTKEKRRNGGGKEMARVLDQIPFITTVAMMGHETTH